MLHFYTFDIVNFWLTYIAYQLIVYFDFSRISFGLLMYYFYPGNKIDEFY